MRKFVAIAAALVSFGFAIPTAAQTGSSGTIAGTITDDARHPVSGAQVALSGSGRSEKTTTDDRGRYTFAALPPGSYEVTISKGGFSTAREGNVALAGGATVYVDIRLVPASFGSLQTIASVRSSRRGNFNTSPAATDIVSSQTFEEQGSTQVLQALNEVPGMQISFPGSSANGASAGAITFPNIRNGLSYETASLIDGHPVAVGEFGDYVTTFLNPALLQSAEVIKGPGANAPEVDYAINGSVNFRTKDPTATPLPFFSVGATNTGGSLYSLGISDTILNGRLGFVVGVAGVHTQTWLNNTPVYFDPGSGSGNINGTNGYPYGCNGLNGSSTPTPLFGTPAKTFYSRVYNGCSALALTTVGSEFDNVSELVKLKYKVGNNTWLTGSYFGSQTISNQSGNTSGVIPVEFQPGTAFAPGSPGYTGSLKPGSIVDSLSAAFDAQPQFETNNEPIFQLELNTSFSNNDTLLARFYHATIDRVQNAGLASPFTPFDQQANIYGTLSAFKTGATNQYFVPFNGQSYTIQQYNYFNEPELDQLDGYSLQYTHTFGSTNELTASTDYTGATSVDYENELGFGKNQCQLGAIPGGYCYETVTSLPQGSGQNFLHFLLRDREQFTDKFSGTFAVYENIYHSSYPTDCDATSTVYCAPNGTFQPINAKPDAGTPVNFASSTIHHTDPRMGLEWRPHRNVAVRFAMGSAISPPFLYVLSRPNGAITAPAQAGVGSFATQTINSGNLQPETAWSYNIGADYALNDNNTFVRADVYQTNLFGQYLNETYFKGLCPTTICQPNTPLQVSSYVNLSNARYEGIELAIRRSPRVGVGYVVQGSTQRGYAYNLPANFYCGIGVAPGACTPSQYTANLNIVSGQNYQGEFINNKGSTTSGVSNQSVPYLQGTAQINYRFPNDAFVLFGDTLYGKNNSLNRPPFGVAYAALTYPIYKSLSLQVAGSNIFNTYSGLFPVWGGGVTVPLVNGQQAATVGNVWGPARYTFTIRTYFGGGDNTGSGGGGRPPRN
jgi:Carboxypeptidase regulatory-like domain/TonB dependent receptor/TonB-dependent Receptor Plug Domain